jgi:hypothetical protein
VTGNDHFSPDPETQQYGPGRCASFRTSVLISARHEACTAGAEQPASRLVFLFPFNKAGRGAHIVRTARRAPSTPRALSQVAHRDLTPWLGW